MAHIVTRLEYDLDVAQFEEMFRGQAEFLLAQVRGFLATYAGAVTCPKHAQLYARQRVDFVNQFEIIAAAIRKENAARPDPFHPVELEALIATMREVARRMHSLCAAECATRAQNARMN